MKINASGKKQALIHAAAGEVTIKAAEKDGDKIKAATFSVEAYTGGALDVEGYDLPIAIDLAGVTFAKNVVANLDHNRSMRVGHVTAHTIDAGILTLSGVASAATPYRKEVVESAENGFSWEASIEAYPTVITEVSDGETIDINGQTLSGPIYVASKSKLTGFAFVSHGADPNTTTTIAATGDKKGATKMDPKFRQFCIEMGIADPDKMTESLRQLMQASFEGNPKPLVTAKPSSAKDAAMAERRRRDEINEYADKLADPAFRNVSEIDHIYAIAAEAIAEGKSFLEFRLDMNEVKLGSVTVRTKQSNRLDAKSLEAAVAITGGLKNIGKHYHEDHLNAADSMFPQGIRLNKLFCLAAEEHGMDCRHANTITPEIMRAAWGDGKYRPVHGSGFSTTSLPGLLSNVANKFLLSGWEGGDMTWARIASITPVNDFKTRTSYRLNDFLEYEQVGKSGDIPHGQVGETEYTNRAKTYGRSLAITREDFINDDLGALTQVPRALGIGAIESLNQIFWAKFLLNDDEAGNDFFHSSNGNVATGAFDIDAVSAAEAVLLKQTKPNGEPLSLRAQILLVPSELKRKAMAAIGSAIVVTGENTTLGNANVWQGELRVESSPYLSNSTYSGNSAVKYYLLADPDRMSVIDVVFLNGRQTPIIETTDAEFSTLGIRMRGYHDFGVAMMEPRGGVQSSGAD